MREADHSAVEAENVRLTGLLRDAARREAEQRQVVRDARRLIAALSPGTANELARLAGTIVRLGVGTKLDSVPQVTPGCGCSGQCRSTKPSDGDFALLRNPESLGRLGYTG
jgi:hypothetical protein